MAKGIYIGGSVPKYITTTETVNITAGNISAYFTVSNSNYYFVGSGSTFTTNNGGVASSTAKTTLTAKQDMSNITFNYSYSSEAGWDKFTLTVAGTVVENGVSGATTTKSYNGTLSAGDIIIFQYAKDGSANANNDKCTFSDMVIQIQTLEQDGTIDNVARKVTQPYIGVDGVARKYFAGNLLWHKYSCDISCIYGERSSTSATVDITNSSYQSGVSATAHTYGGYRFDSTTGFYGTDGALRTDVTAETTLSDLSVLVGRYYQPNYRINNTYVQDSMHLIRSVDRIVNVGGLVPFDVYCSTTKYYATTTFVYEKGTTSYGTIETLSSELPEEGTLVKGSVAEGYCVLQVGSDYYYYEKEI